VLFASHIVPPIEGKHSVGCDRTTKADHLLSFPVGWYAGEDIIDGPGPVGFDATAILFVTWRASRGTAFIVPDADRVVVTPPFDFFTCIGSWSWPFSIGHVGINDAGKQRGAG
jgi:hypothetical protein